MERVVHALARWYLARPLHVARGGAVQWLERHQDAIVVSSKSVARLFNDARPGIIDMDRAIIDPPIEIAMLDDLVPRTNSEWIAGVGGGRVMDAAKYLALKARKRFCAIPTVLSTTSWLNFAIAARRDGVLSFPGTIRASRIVVDPAIITSSPHELTLGGVADIACACSALGDWQLASKATGENIHRGAFNRFLAFTRALVSGPEALVPLDERAVERVCNLFLEALAWCGATFSGRPLEGAEHFLYYCIDEMDARRFIHGRIIALTTVISLHAQGQAALFDPGEVQSFFEHLGIPITLAANDLTRDDVDRTLARVESFTRERGLPRSTWNGPWDRDAVNAFLDTA